MYLKVLGISNVLGFDFLDRPSEGQLRDALLQLHTLGALDAQGEVTEIGKKMSAFSVEPSLGRMLVEALDLPKVSYRVYSNSAYM